MARLLAALLAAAAVAAAPAAAAAAPARAVSVYTGSGNATKTLAWVNARRAAFTGVYPCCNNVQFAANGSLVLTRSMADLTAETAQLRAAGLTVHWVASISNLSVTSGSWRSGGGIAAAVAAVQAMGADGLIVDYEPSVNYTLQHAQAYGDFLAALAAALHAAGRYQLGFDTAGWGILDEWAVYSKTGVDIATSMTPTYFNMPALHRPFLQGALAGGMPLAVMGAGVGTTLTPAYTPEWDYKWNASALDAFVELLQGLGIPRMDLWRADIDRSWPPEATQPWVLDAAERFLSGA